MQIRLTAADLEGVTGWRKSERSGPNSDNCVELAPYGDGVALRSTEDTKAGGLFFKRGELEAFAAGFQAGEFDDMFA
jgi:hypothetical protein